MDNITRDLDGVISIADDIIVFGTDDSDHDMNLHNLMQRARENNLVFNPDKCVIKVPEVTFFGTIYGSEGVRPDPARTQEINDLPEPNNRQELQSFLGMVQYLAPFLPHLSNMTAPLRGLLKKDADFV